MEEVSIPLCGEMGEVSMGVIREMGDLSFPLGVVWAEADGELGAVSMGVSWEKTPLRQDRVM